MKKLFLLMTLVLLASISIYAQQEVLVYDSGDITEFPYSHTLPFNSSAWSALDLPEGIFFNLRKVIDIEFIGLYSTDYVSVNVTTEDGTEVYTEEGALLQQIWIGDATFNVLERFGVGSSISTTLTEGLNEDYIDLSVRVRYYYVSTM